MVKQGIKMPWGEKSSNRQANKQTDIKKQQEKAYYRLNNEVQYKWWSSLREKRK